jgi:hypothetical protein
MAIDNVATTDSQGCPLVTPNTSSTHQPPEKAEALQGRGDVTSYA